MTDPINHPKHYTEHPSGVECIQITEHMSFNLGNATKYIWRADLKGAQVQDLEKAAWYIHREIGRLRGHEPQPQSLPDSDLDHLRWIHGRLVKVHGENINTDYMRRLRPKAPTAAWTADMITRKRGLFGYCWTWN